MLDKYHTESIGNLCAALLKAQKDMPTIPKDKTARVPTKKGGSYSYKYADLPTIIDTVTPILNKHGLGVIQVPMDGRMMTVILHKDGEYLAGEINMPTGTSPQELGSWITYLRRYSLTAMLGIAADEDDDAGSAQAAHTARKAAPTAPASATVKGATVKAAQDVLGGVVTGESTGNQSGFEDAIHNLYDVGVGALIGRVDDPKKDMAGRMTKLLRNIGRERVSEITNRDEQTAFYNAMRDEVDEIEAAVVS